MDNSAVHPWLGRFERVESIPDWFRVCTFLVGHAASGNLSGVRTDWAFIPRSDQRTALELLLQNSILAGYPRTIAALAEVRDIGVYVECATEKWLPKTCFERGEEVCRRLWGDEYHTVYGRLVAINPVMAQWSIEIAYGLVLSRPGPTLRERELAATMVLAGPGTARALISHINGALRSGATMQECAAILSQTAAIWGVSAQDEVNEVWNAYTCPRELSGFL